MSAKDLTISLLSLAHTPENATRIYTEKIQHRPLYLKPNPTTTAQALRRETRHSKTSQSKSKNKNKPKPLSSRQKRSLQIYALPSSPSLKYETYLPLHNLWISYIQALLNLSPSKTTVGPSEAAKLCGADFHGARLEVVRSKCVGRVGLKGVVVKDSMGVFEMVCPGKKVEKGGEGNVEGNLKDETKGNGGRKAIVPKEGTVFRFKVPIPVTVKETTDGGERNATPNTKEEKGTILQTQGIDGDAIMVGNDRLDASNLGAEQKAKPKELIFELHGDQFIYRAADRANRKFKSHFLRNL